MPFPPKAGPILPPKEAERDAMSPAMARQKARALALKARSRKVPPPPPDPSALGSG